MDPLGLQAPHLGWVRPAIALQSDLSAVLREGRVLAGEVLQTFDGGALLIGIGRHRIAAQSQVALEAGQRFLFAVEGEGDELALRILAPQSEGEPELLKALRSVLGADPPLGQLVDELLQALQDDASSTRLRESLIAYLTNAGANAQQLAETLLGGGPLVYEARLALAAALSLPADEAAALGEDLQRWLLAGLQPEGSDASASELAERLRASIAELLGGSPSRAGRERAFAAWLTAADRTGASAAIDLAQLLELAVARCSTGAEQAALLARLRALNPSQLGRGLEVLLLRSLLAVEPSGPEGATRRMRQLASRAGGELKAQLIEALARLEPGRARDAVARALDGLEAEQLLDVARRRDGEALHWSVPLLDGKRWTTAHLFVQRERRESAEERALGDVWRMSLALDLSGTGPLRADLCARPGFLEARVRAARPATVSALAAGLAELQSRLAVGGRRVAVRVAAAAPEALSTEDAAADVRYLREHPLMDLSA
jgi:Flagellar hook-length control protein FliK